MRRVSADRGSFYEAKYAAGEEIQRTSKLYTLSCVPDDGPLEILDIGCGTGLNSVWLAARGHRITGVDISREAIAKYRERGFTGMTMDVEAGIEFDDGSFDCVLCSEVIEHVVDPEALTGEMRRVLRPEGTLVLSTPNSAFWLYRLFALAGYTPSELQHRKHIQFFSRRSLTRLVRDAGFEIPEVLGRNMYMILPDPGSDACSKALALAGFMRETRFRTGRDFWHFSRRSSLWNSLFADTLIVRATKSNMNGGP